MEVKNYPPSDNELRVSIRFDKGQVKLEYSLIGVVVHLADCQTAAEPGAPALPHANVHIALPARTRLVGMKAEAPETVPLSSELIPIAPVQFSRAGQQKEGRPYSRPGEQRDYQYQGGDPRQQEPPFVEPFPLPAYVPPDPELYAGAIRQPAAEQLTTSLSGLNQIVSLRLHPVKLNENGLLDLNTHIDLVLHFEPAGNEGEGPENITSRAQAMRQVALTRRMVVNPEVIFDISDSYPVFNTLSDYLVITDNQSWNAETIAPIGAAGGDLVAAFGRLAAWKRSRGVTSRVVTITDIVGNRYGNFRTGSRDLQEVLRRFLKWAHTHWGIAWVLLGGDTDIVPARGAAGGREGNINRQTATNPPPDNTSFWTGTFLKMHVVNPGIWYGADARNILVRPDNGLLIPYDVSGTSGTTQRGWYFTTTNSYATRSAMPTDFIRVNGPATDINADLQFLYEWNTIPTDLYYSSLVGPLYDQPGKHDWDLVSNSVYGQHFGSNELDGINYTPTVSIGRAPVSNSTQADTFVNKVISYEQFKRPDGTGLDDNWPKKVVFVSENWGGRLWFGSTGDNPPGANLYHHTAGQTHTLIHLQDLPDYNWSLLAYLSEADVRLIPFRTDAAAAGRGWCFAVSDTNLSPSLFTISIPFGTPITFPLPTLWIVVYGTPEELAPAAYIFNNISLDGSANDQEELREQMASEMPGFYNVKRLYEDIQDMTPAQVAAAPLELITTAGLITALNAGPHIVSLSGHGNAGGCCRLGYGVADDATNGYHTFITYADSCLTNQYDGDSMSEHLINNMNGGAVAYVGNSRFSWIGVGDDIQRRFFHEWAELGGDAHIGLLNDTRAELVNSFYWADGRWAIMSLHLMGDPEMPLWWRNPLRFKVPDLVFFPDRLHIIMEPPPPPDPRWQLPYSKNWGLSYVHLRQGSQEQIVLAAFNGEAELPLANFRSGPATLTIARAGYQPIVQQIMISKPGKKHSRGILLAALIVGGLVLAQAINIVWRKSRR